MAMEEAGEGAWVPLLACWLLLACAHTCAWGRAHCARLALGYINIWAPVDRLDIASTSAKALNPGSKYLQVASGSGAPWQVRVCARAPCTPCSPRPATTTSFFAKDYEFYFMNFLVTTWLMRT